MPEYVSGGGRGEGHMVLGRGSKGYLVTIVLPEPRGIMLVEVWHDSMIGAIAYVQEISEGEVVCCLKLWV